MNNINKHSFIFVQLLLLLLVANKYVSGQPFVATTSATGGNCNSGNHVYPGCNYALSFNITSPVQMTGSIGYAPCDITHPIKLDGALNVRILLPNSNEPDHGFGVGLGNKIGCPVSDPTQPYGIQSPTYTYTTADDGTPYAGQALLVLRGTCSFSLKQKAAQMLGLSLIIIADINPVNNFVDGLADEPLIMVGDYGSYVTIPTIAINAQSGSQLYNFIKANPATPVSMSIWGAGHVTNPTTRAALNELGTGFTYTLVPPAQVIPQPSLVNPLLRFWSDVNNTSLDPCFDAVQGLWCEQGEPVFFSVGQFTNFKGQLLDAPFSALKKLRILYSGQGGVLIEGPFPSSWCQWAEEMSFSYLILNANSFTSIPDCFDRLPYLQKICLDGTTTLGMVPASISQAPNLIYASFASVGATNAIAPSFSNAKSLTFLNLENNQLTGGMPDFSGIKTTIRSIRLGLNKLSDTLNPAVFDGYTNLMTLGLQNNNFISSSLPSLSGGTQANLTSIDFSSNKFGGSLPSTWTASFVSHLVAIKLNNNQLVNPPPPAPNGYAILTNLNNKITTLDLSHNLIEMAPADGFIYTLTGFIFTISSPFLQTIDLSYNKIAGPIFVGVTASIPASMRTVIASNNAITYLPNDLFNAPGVTTWDFSNNNLTGIDAGVANGPNLQAGISVGTPPPLSILKFDLSGNPFLTTNTPNTNYGLPFYVTPDFSSQTTRSANSFSCYNFLGIPSYKYLQFSVDPTFYKYNLCTCKEGYYGKAPDCKSIPIANSQQNPTPTLYLNQATSLQTEDRSFTDNWYGNKRFLNGLDSAWTVDASSVEVLNDGTILPVGGAVPAGFTASPVVAVVFYLCFDIGVFNQGTDILDIYTGGSNLRGLIVSSFRGLDIASKSPTGCLNQGQFDPSLYSLPISHLANQNQLYYAEVTVLGDVASAAFTSRDSTGQHFYAAYSATDKCPENYKLVAGTDDKAPYCTPVIIEYKVSSSLQNAIYAISAVLGACVLVVNCILFKYRETTLVRASSKMWSQIMLLFLLALSGGASLYAISPTDGDSNICASRLWVSCIALMGVLAILVARSMRVSVIFGSKILLQIRSVTDVYVAKIAGGFILLQVVMLIIFNVLKMSRAEFVVGGAVIDNDMIWQCSAENGFHSWIGANIAIFGAVMVLGAVVAWRTRAVPSAFNESSHILGCLTIMIFFLIIIVPLDYLVSNSPNAAIVIQAGGQLLLSLCLLLLNFGPKLYYLWAGRGNDKSMVFTSVGTKVSLQGKVSGLDNQSGNNSTVDPHNQSVNGKKAPSRSLVAVSDSSFAASNEDTTELAAVKTGTEKNQV